MLGKFALHEFECRIFHLRFLVCLYSPHRYVSRVFTPSEGPALPVSQICIYSDLCIDLLCFLREYTINTCSCCVLKAFSYQQKCSFRFADILLYTTKEFVVMEHENKYQQKVITFHLRKFNFVMLYYSVIYYV